MKRGDELGIGGAIAAAYTILLVIFGGSIHYAASVGFGEASAMAIALFNTTVASYAIHKLNQEAIAQWRRQYGV
jgi:hypothetical protein